MGLHNIGLTCYANCIVQCLVAIPHMASYFLSDAPVHGPGRKQRPISTAFCHLLRHMWASKHSIVYPDRSADSISVCCNGHHNQLLVVHPLVSAIHVHHLCPPFMSTIHVHHSCPPLLVVHHSCPSFMSISDVHHSCPPLASTAGVHHSYPQLLVHH